jgi:hypothetical protein
LAVIKGLTLWESTGSSLADDIFLGEVKKKRTPEAVLIPAKDVRLEANSEKTAIVYVCVFVLFVCVCVRARVCFVCVCAHACGVCVFVCILNGLQDETQNTESKFLDKISV